MRGRIRPNFQLVSALPHQPLNRESGIDFISAFAECFADRCIETMLARLPKPKKMFPVIRGDRLVLIDQHDLHRFMIQQKS